MARIVRDPRVCFGAPRIEGRRITVGLVHTLLDAGHSPEAICEDLELTADEIAAAMRFIAEQGRGDDGQGPS